LRACKAPPEPWASHWEDGGWAVDCDGKYYSNKLAFELKTQLKGFASKLGWLPCPLARLVEYN